MILCLYRIIIYIRLSAAATLQELQKKTVSLIYNEFDYERSADVKISHPGISP